MEFSSVTGNTWNCPQNSDTPSHLSASPLVVISDILLPSVTFQYQHNRMECCSSLKVLNQCKIFIYRFSIDQRSVLDLCGPISLKKGSSNVFMVVGCWGGVVERSLWICTLWTGFISFSWKWIIFTLVGLIISKNIQNRGNMGHVDFMLGTAWKPIDSASRPLRPTVHPVAL